MDNNRLFLIVNPISGTGSKKGLTDHIVEKLSKAGFEVTTELTTGRGDATRLATRAINQGYYGVLACGGDGTVNETARALCDSGVPLGIIPAGSGNGLARHLGIPVDPILSLDIIAQNHIADCDYCAVNGEPFFCTFGMGFDAVVTRRFSHSGKRGMITYVRSAIDEFNNYEAEDYTLTYDGNTISRRAFLIACCNASQYGNNAFIAPGASMTDGLLDVIIVKDGPKMGKLLVGLDMMTGMIPHNQQIEIIHTPHITIERQGSMPVHLDGEDRVMGKTLDVKCIPGKLRIFTAGKPEVFRPIITPVNYMLRDWKIAISHLFDPQND